MSDNKSQHPVRKVAIGSAIAGVAGYVAGILTAPKSGENTRKQIARSAEDVKDTAEDQLQEVNDELRGLVKTAKDKTINLSTSARAEFNEAVIKAKDTQNKAGEVLKAVKAGEASDPELNKAIKQGKLAIKNLGKYLKG